MPDLPTGTVTFLFTDIEGSTKLWGQYPEAMKAALARHDTLLRTTIEAHGGYVFKTVGDAFCAAFDTAPDALAASLVAQRALHAEAWGETGELRVRMALHTGAADERNGDYFGPPLNRIARLLSTGYGGQILLSLATEELIRDQLPAGTHLQDLGTHRLKDLVRPEQIFQFVAPDLPSNFPPLKSLDTFPNNLPLQLTSFIGREREMGEVKRLLDSARLVTITGPGGTGKTRLSLQVAADLLDSFADGVWLVELAALTDSVLVPQAVAMVLAVREEPGQPLLTTLTAYLREKQVLLVLDNCEHLVVACAQLAEALLRACPKLRLLASSREGLGIGGETVFRVPPLSLPDAQHLPSVETLTQYEAVQLFIDRAVAIVPAFTVTNQNAPALAQVCHRLDGIPLALELAAARVKVLAVEQIAARLDDRFRLLTGGSRTAQRRQQTLQAAIDWSYDLLSAPERALLRRLSVFEGGGTLEAAEVVCAGSGIEAYEVLDLLAQLVDKSLVVYAEQGGQAWYRLLETVRQYARDRLMESGGGEAKTLKRQHAHFFVRLAEEADLKLSTAEQRQWLNRLEVEYGNLRAALDELARGEETEMGLRLAASLWRFWHMRGYLSEGRQRLEQFLAMAGESTPVKVRMEALHCAGVLADAQGDYAAARSHFEETLAFHRATGDKLQLASSLTNLGNSASAQGDYAAARALYEESLAISREIRYPPMVAWTLNSLASVARSQHDYAAARSLYEESLAIYRKYPHEVGISGCIAVTLNDLGGIVYAQGDCAAARSLYEESLAYFRTLGNSGGIAISLYNLGDVATAMGDYTAARSLYAESLTIVWDLGDKLRIAQCLAALAGIARLQGRTEGAVRMFAAAHVLFETIGTPRLPSERNAHERLMDALRSALGEEAFVAAWTESQAMPLEQTIAAALEGGGLPPIIPRPDVLSR